MYVLMARSLCCGTSILKEVHLACNNVIAENSVKYTSTYTFEFD